MVFFSSISLGPYWASRFCRLGLGQAVRRRPQLCPVIRPWEGISGLRLDLASIPAWNLRRGPGLRRWLCRVRISDAARLRDFRDTCRHRHDLSGLPLTQSFAAGNWPSLNSRTSPWKKGLNILTIALSHG